MKPVSIAGALALLLVISACGGREQTAQNSQSPAGGASANAATYSITGRITAIEGDRVTISHGPVQGLGWPAMTMTFLAGDPSMLQGVSVGDRVAFQFRQRGSDYPLIALSKAR